MDEAIDGTRVVVAVDPDKLIGESMLIRTVFEKEMRTDEELV